MCTVTVYITNYNYEKYVEKAIISVLNQTYGDYELLIFDDGSTDNSLSIIQKYQDHSKVTIIKQQNQGLINTANNALDIAKGKYIIRLDADDYFDENALLVMVNHLKTHQEYDLVYPDYFEIDDNDNVRTIIQRKNLKDMKILDLPMHGACTLIRTQILKDLGGYDTNIKRQDGYNFWIKFIQKCIPSNINLPLFYYRKHLKSLTASNTKILQARQQIKANFVKKSNNALIIPIRPENVVEDMMFQRINEKYYIDYILDKINTIDAECYIVTSDKKILDYCKDYKTIQRSPDLELPGVDIKASLNLLPKTYDYIGVYFPTSPLIKPSSINEAFHTIDIFNAGKVISVQQTNDVLYTHKENGLVPLVNTTSLLRKERDMIYKYTGGIIIYSNKNDTTGHIVIDDLESFDINDKISFWICKKVIESLKEFNTIENIKINRGY